MTNIYQGEIVSRLKVEMPEWWQRDRTEILLCCANGILAICFGLHDAFNSWNNSNLAEFLRPPSNTSLLIWCGMNVGMILFFHEMGRQNRLLMNRQDDVQNKNDASLNFFSGNKEMYLRIIEGGSWAFNHCIPYLTTFPESIHKTMSS